MRDWEERLLEGLSTEAQDLVRQQLAEDVEHPGFLYSPLQGHRLTGHIHAPFFLPGKNED